MIDLKKEYEVFAGHFGLPKSNENNPILQCGWLAWKTRAELAQAEINKEREQATEYYTECEYLKAEITELKQKLEKIESGEFVLVPREPTKEVIIGLASGYFSEDGSPWLDPEQSYREMLSAIAAVEKDHE